MKKNLSHSSWTALALAGALCAVGPAAAQVAGGTTIVGVTVAAEDDRLDVQRAAQQHAEQLDAAVAAHARTGACIAEVVGHVIGVGGIDDALQGVLGRNHHVWSGCKKLRSKSWPRSVKMDSG